MITDLGGKLLVRADDIARYGVLLGDMFRPSCGRIK